MLQIKNELQTNKTNMEEKTGHRDKKSTVFPAKFAFVLSNKSISANLAFLGM